MNPHDMKTSELSNQYYSEQSDDYSYQQHYPFDLTDNIKIGRKNRQYERTKYDNRGKAVYIYRHVLKTFADPKLMALRTSPLYSDSDPVLNSGHAAKEIVYVLVGSVKLYWKSKQGQIRESVLNEGDSVYLSPMVPHGFVSVGDIEPQILAVDF